MSVMTPPSEQTAGLDSSSPTIPSPIRRQRKKKSLPGVVGKQLMMLCRRIHLYSGLFMFPWVLMYGFTGWFFNHPTYFTGDRVQTFSGVQLAENGGQGLPAPSELAETVVDEINFQSFLVDGPEVILTDDLNPQFDRYLGLTVTTDHQSHRIQIHPVTGSGEIRTTFVNDDSASEEEATELPVLQMVPDVQVPATTVSVAQAAIPDLLKALDLEPGEAEVGRFAPRLVFSASVDGQPCRVQFDTQNGRLQVEAADRASPTMDPKLFSQRLHMARGYSPTWGVRTLWAVSVDAMFLSMVFWGCSGILMWWQIKRTRRVGAVVLLASLLCAVWLVVGMHEELSGQRRGRGHGRATAQRTQPRNSATQAPSAGVTSDMPRARHSH